ncbi:hypothetical protein CR513_58112, partial [Mucuna pruriens]
MKRMIFEKFFATSRTATIRKEICGIKQHSEETLHEYWVRFNKFVDGQDFSSNETPDLEYGEQHVTIRDQRSHHVRVVNEVGVIDNLRLENQLTELTSLVRQLTVGQHQPSAPPRVCGICTFMEHPIDMCPMLQEIELDNVEILGSIGGYQYAVPTESKSRAIYGPKIQIRTKHLLAAGSEIPSTTVPTLTATTGSAIGQFTFDGRVDEAVEHE